LAGGTLWAGLPAVAGVPEMAVLVGWAVTASGLLFWVWRISWPRDSEGTKRLAEEEARTRVTDNAVLGAGGGRRGARGAQPVRRVRVPRPVRYAGPPRRRHRGARRPGGDPVVGAGQHGLRSQV